MCIIYRFVAYATPKTFAENPVFMRLLGKNLSSLIFSRVFLPTTRAGLKFAMRTQFVQNDRPQDESIQLVPKASKIKAIRDIRAVKPPCPGILTAIYCPQQIRAMSACFGLSQGDLESEYPLCTAVISCWCSLSEKLFSILCQSFFHPIIILALLSPSHSDVVQLRSGVT